ncbi:TetR/AcrR family transcriptional regulator [Streptomyces vilmorinianum]|uniref:TetR/AcrR family transcriptional regulator n=1 Tax=Streptomyces vilmorinianum TaxID=3051092 RepID=UPI0020C82309|nr:TetR/AcrR family transcriptional regulator [Streptomyces vilmorinianum]
MSASESPGGPSRVRPRRRADAERSRAAVLDAAVRLLAERPDAGMAAIATAAGVTRQTVYAHFGTRDALLEAVADRITDDAMAAMDEAEAAEESALGSLLRLQDIGWRLFERHPVLLQLGSAEADRTRHEPVIARLTRLIENGQSTGEFAPTPPATWLVAAVTALSHAAGDEAAAGRLTVQEAATCLRTATLAVLEARPPEPPSP